MDSWEAVLANTSVAEALHLVSGLSYIQLPNLLLLWDKYAVPNTYFGFQNGLFYQTPWYFESNELPAINYSKDVCTDATITSPITDPAPFNGYDCRCRPWYQESITSKNETVVEIGNPYIFISNSEGEASKIGVTLTHYFKLADEKNDSSLP